MDERLRLTLGLLEKITTSPTEIIAADLEPLRTAGISDRAILDATYVCVGFNIIARIADALGFKIPSEQVFLRAARLLRVFGYRRLSGFWTNGLQDRKNGHIRTTKQKGRKATLVDAFTVDPFDGKMTQLRHAVLSGPGSLPSEIRKDISEGRKPPGVLGEYVTKVGEHAYLIKDDDIAELYLSDYSDDQIFEATVSAALGAGLVRLECVLRALRSNEPAKTISDELTKEVKIVSVSA